MWGWVIVTILVFKKFAFWFFGMLTKSSHISLIVPRNSLIPYQEFLPAVLNYQKISKPIKAGLKCHHFPLDQI